MLQAELITMRTQNMQTADIDKHWNLGSAAIVCPTTVSAISNKSAAQRQYDITYADLWAHSYNRDSTCMPSHPRDLGDNSCRSFYL